MNSLIQVEPRLAEIGRIRLGSEKLPNRPGQPLDNFRITVESKEKDFLEMAASLYALNPGGEPNPVLPWWPGGKPQNADPENPPYWQLYTTAPKLQIAIPPIRSTYSSCYELWKGGYCIRRCDGVNATWYQPLLENVKGKQQKVYKKMAGKCQCDLEDEHPDPANTCKPTARLNILLVGLPASGVFRLETHSKTFMHEAPAMVSLAEAVFAHTGAPVRADLYIVARKMRNLAFGERNIKIPIVRIHEALTMEVLNAAARPPELTSGRPNLQIVGPRHTEEDSETPPTAEPPPMDEPPPPPDANLDISDAEYREEGWDAAPPDYTKDPEAWRTWCETLTFGEIKAFNSDKQDKQPLLYIVGWLKDLGVTGEGSIQLALGMDPVLSVDHLVTGVVLDELRAKHAAPVVEPPPQQEAML